MSVTVDQIRQALAPDTPVEQIRPGQRRRRTDPQDDLRRRLFDEMDAASRVAVILQYGVDRFIEQWAARVERRRAAGHFRMTEAGTRRTFDPTPEEAWQNYGYHYIEALAGGASGDRRILLPLSQFDLRHRGQLVAARRAAQEPHWIQYFFLFFTQTSFLHPVHGGSVPRQTGNPRLGPRSAPTNGGVARIGRWVLDNWAQFVERASPLGAAAGRLQAQPGPHWEARRNDTWSRSLWVLSRDAATRQRGLPYGLTYFGNIYAGYAHAYGQLCADALTLEDACRRGGIARERRVQSRMRSNLTIWRASLLVTLTRPNRVRFDAMDQCFDRFWRNGVGVNLGTHGRLLDRAGIYGGSGLNMRAWDLEAR